MFKEQSKSDPKPRRGGAKAAEAARVAAIFERFEAAEPHPKGELIHTNIYTLLVAVVLSAQATDVGVNKATAALFAVADTPAKMVALGEERLLDYIKTIGLFRAKARNVVALSKLLIERHGGAVPHDRAALEALPGVGRKTANVVLNIGFGEPVIAVDTHIFRVSNRLPLAVGKTRRGGRGRAGEARARPLQAPRPSLADPARPLCLQGAQALVREMLDRGFLPLRGEDGIARPIEAGAPPRAGSKARIHALVWRPRPAYNRRPADRRPRRGAPRGDLRARVRRNDRFSRIFRGLWVSISAGNALVKATCPRSSTIRSARIHDSSG